MSTSPTLISSRMKSSESMLPSGKSEPPATAAARAFTKFANCRICELSNRTHFQVRDSMILKSAIYNLKFDNSPIRQFVNFSSHSPQPEPIKLIWPHSQQIGQIPNAREDVPAEHLNQNVSAVRLQIEFYRLGRAGEVVHDQDDLITQLAHVRQHAMIRGIQKLDGATSKYRA